LTQAIYKKIEQTPGATAQRLEKGAPPGAERRRVPPVTRLLRVGLLGLGNVGQAVAELCCASRQRLRGRGIELAITTVLVRDEHRPRRFIPPGAHVTSDPLDFFGRRHDLIIETIGGVDAALRYVSGCLRSGIPVVTANKSLLAAHGWRLAQLARQHGVSLRGEASAIAGVPFLTTLRQRPFAARVQRVCGILNGTSNYVLTQIASRGVALVDALRQAQELGYAEPNADFDINGRDAAEKLAVIWQHLGLERVRTGAVEVRGIGGLTPRDLREARNLGGVIKPVALGAVADGRLEGFVGPALVPLSHPLAGVTGSQNAVVLSGEQIGELVFAGPGAGPAVTAGTILDDVVETALDPAGERCGVVEESERRLCDWQAPRTEWLVRFCFPQRQTRYTAAVEFFESRGIGLRQLLGAAPAAAGDLLYAHTEAQPREAIEAAVGEFSRRCACTALCLRVLPR